MTDLFRKIQCSERLPDEIEWYDTDMGNLKYEGIKYNKPRWTDDNHLRSFPDYWYEKVKEPIIGLLKI